MTSEDQIQEIVKEVVSKYGMTSPRVVAVLDEVRSGKLSLDLAPRRLLEVLESEGAMATLAKESSDQDQGAFLEIIEEHGLTEDDIFYLDDRGQLKINPFYLGAIQERLQFDGDIPELRVGGDIPEGGYPAVPVETKAVSLVVVGMQLLQARDEVSEELKDAQETLLEENQKSLLRTPERCLQNLALPLSVKGYEAGKIPALRKVSEPTGIELSTISKSVRGHLAWITLSSTQGRKSLSPGIGQRVAKNLRNKGIDVTFTRRWESRGKFKAEAKWEFAIRGHNLNPDFPFVEHAVLSLSKKLFNTLEESSETLELHVRPINRISQRRVGWHVRIRSL